MRNLYSLNKKQDVVARFFRVSHDSRLRPLRALGQLEASDRGYARLCHGPCFRDHDRVRPDVAEAGTKLQVSAMTLRSAETLELLAFPKLPLVHLRG
jgi:hypothetical protein